MNIFSAIIFIPVALGFIKMINIAINEKDQNKKMASIIMLAIVIIPLGYFGVEINSGKELSRKIDINEIGRKINKAVAEIERSSAENGSFANIYNNGVNWYNKRDYEKAANNFKKALEIKPKDIMAACYLAAAYTYGGDTQQGLEICDEAIKINPSYSWTYFIKGCAYIKLKTYDKAVKEFTKSITLYSGYYHAYISRGYAYMELKDFEKALADFNAAIKLNTKDIGGYLSKAAALTAKGDVDKAMELYTKLESLFPRSPYVYAERAEAYFKLADYANALKDVKKAESLGLKFKDGFAEKVREAAKGL